MSKVAFASRIMSNTIAKDNNLIVLMLSGYLESGKDSVAEVLQKDYNFTRIAFADVLKDAVSKHHNIPRHLMDTDKGKKSIWEGRTVRQYLIDYGQNARKDDPLVWVKPVCKLIKSFQNRAETNKFVITDWRMPNEYTGICDMIGTDNVIKCRVNRWEKAPLDDYTEKALDDETFHVVFDNTKELKDLPENVASNMKTLDLCNV